MLIRPGRLGSIGRTSRSAPRGLPIAQIVAFGEKTRRGHGGHKLGYAGAGTLSITAGNGAGVWAIVGNELVMAGTYGAAPPALAGPYALTVTDGASTSAVTVNITPYAAHIAPNAADSATVFQMQALLNSSILSFGDTVLLRSGVYNPAQLDQRPTKKAEFTQRSGGPAMPVGLSDAGMVRIVSEIPYQATVARWMFDGTTVPAQYMAVEQIDFFRPCLDPAAGTASAALANNNAVPFTDFRASNNRARSSFYPGTTAAGQNGQDNINAAIRLVGSPLDPTRCSRIEISGNDVYDAIYGIAVAGTDIVIRGNTIRRIWVDCINGPITATAAGKSLVEDNFLCDKLYGDGAYHGDFIQTNYDPNFPAGSYYGAWYRRNTIVRGQGRSGFFDGQGIFVTNAPDLVSLLGVLVENNVIEQTFTRGITLDRCIDAVVRLNTVLRDQQGDVPTIYHPGISFRRCERGVADRNIVHRAAGETPIISESPVIAPTITADNLYLTAAAYTTAMLGPVYGAAAGSVAAVLAGVTPITGGPARLSSGQYIGAMDATGVYTSITITVSGTLPDAIVGQAYNASLVVTPAGAALTLPAATVTLLNSKGIAHDGFGRFTSASVTA